MIAQGLGSGQVYGDPLAQSNQPSSVQNVLDANQLSALQALINANPQMLGGSDAAAAAPHTQAQNAGLSAGNITASGGALGESGGQSGGQGGPGLGSALGGNSASAGSFGNATMGLGTAMNDALTGAFGPVGGMAAKGAFGLGLGPLGSAISIGQALDSIMGLLGVTGSSTGSATDSSTANAPGADIGIGGFTGSTVGADVGSAAASPGAQAGADIGVGGFAGSNVGLGSGGGTAGGDSGVGAAGAGAGGAGGDAGGIGGGGDSGGGGECFAGDTPILMADNTTKPIQHIRPGDMVMAFREDDPMGSLSPQEVVAITVNGVEKDTTLINGEIQVTSSHPFLMADGKFYPIGDFRIGDFMVDAAGNSIEVISRLRVPLLPAKVWNFEVGRLHTYVAGGMRVHNKYAYGGIVRGKGGPRDDSIQTRVSDGEGVLSNPTVTALGEDLVNKLNSIGNRKGDVVKKRQAMMKLLKEVSSKKIA